MQPRRLRQALETYVFNMVQAGLYVATGSPQHEGRYFAGTWCNWNGQVRARPASFHRPHSEAELAAIVGEARSLRVVGAGYSFNTSPLSSDAMVSLDNLARILEVDRIGKTVRVEAGIRMRDLNAALNLLGLGLPLLGSADAQSLAGELASDSHGSGREHGFVSEQVLSLRVMNHAGEVRTVRPGDPLFHAAIGGLGVCGIITEVELQAVESFNLEKHTAMVDRRVLDGEVDELLANNEHLSFYLVGGAEPAASIRMHRWNRTDAPVSRAWQQRRALHDLYDFVTSGFAPRTLEWLARTDDDAWLSNLLAPDRRLVMPGGDGFVIELYFRHEELEHGVPLERWRPALAAVMHALQSRESFTVVEVRFTPDRSPALLGPGSGRATCHINLATSLVHDAAAVHAAVEQVLLAHGGQPHLGKRSFVTVDQMQAIHGQRFTEFQAVRAEQDPVGKFLNPFTTRVFGSP
jgi:FAD/FMN-containing dehydrogenase